MCHTPQIPQCTCHIPHNAPFCNRKVDICAHFCYRMLHCGILWVCEMGILDESLCRPYIDVKWTSWHLRSHEIRLFVELLLHIKHESSTALVLCWRNLRVTRRFSSQRAGNGGSVSMSWRDQAMSHWGILTHWGRDKMAASFLTFSNASFWLKML